MYDFLSNFKYYYTKYLFLRKIKRKKKKTRSEIIEQTSHFFFFGKQRNRTCNYFNIPDELFKPVCKIYFTSKFLLSILIKSKKIFVFVEQFVRSNLYNRKYSFTKCTVRSIFLKSNNAICKKKRNISKSVNIVTSHVTRMHLKFRFKHST